MVPNVHLLLLLLLTLAALLELIIARLGSHWTSDYQLFHFRACLSHHRPACSGPDWS